MEADDGPWSGIYDNEARLPSHRSEIADIAEDGCSTVHMPRYQSCMSLAPISSQNKAKSMATRRTRTFPGFSDEVDTLPCITAVVVQQRLGSLRAARDACHEHDHRSGNAGTDWEQRWLASPSARVTK